MKELITLTGGLIVIVVLLLVLAGTSVGYGIWLGSIRPIPTQVRSMVPTVTQLERIGELTTTRVHVIEVLWADGEGYRASWHIKGDALLSCNMPKAKIAETAPEIELAGAVQSGGPTLLFLRFQ